LTPVSEYRMIGTLMPVRGNARSESRFKQWSLAMGNYQDADRCCDLVMKGGVTSGVLYPSAICQIAEKYHLVGIGGSSAGAIAACTAAAAEYRRRQSGSGEGFERLRRMADELASPGKMLGLFRPDGTTRGEFKLFLRATQKSKRSRWPWLRWIPTILRLMLFHHRVLRRLIHNGFGICSGMAVGNPAREGETPPLTEWLARIIDEIAGKEDGRPLTFGDLRRASKPDAQRELACSEDEHSINLRSVTTCVSFGRPMELPLDGIKTLAFDEREWRGLFPAYVVDYLVEVAKTIEMPSLGDSRKLPLPTGDALPVVVAARMSLSFPLLFTMVPLYAVDFAGTGKLRRVWFSDGGITSNLPIHRFDAFFPRWPTLAINLQSINAQGQPSRKAVDLQSKVYVTGKTGDGTEDLWADFEAGDRPAGSLLGFVTAVFRSAQNWHDNSYLKLPGYRDRVVEIWLTQEEGGLNLSMPQHLIEGLITRGEIAGRMIRDRFSQTPPEESLSWDGHRWIRLRSGMSGLLDYLLRFQCSADRQSMVQRSLAELLASKDAPPTLRFTRVKQHAEAKATVEALLSYLGGIAMSDAGPGSEGKRQSPRHPFRGGPRPPMEIGGRAPM
jgi:predicted acylesterase/phospholipase RssA